MSGRLQNKIAIVTGASSGVGRAIALQLAHDGATVVCSDVRELPRPEACPDADKSTHELILSSGGESMFWKTDVTKPEEVESLIKMTVEHYGRLDMYDHPCFSSKRPNILNRITASSIMLERALRIHHKAPSRSGKRVTTSSIERCRSTRHLSFMGSNTPPGI